MNQKAGRVTIREVASAAGVSMQTVSRVINERPDVSPETRRRVKNVIEKLGYRPSTLARGLIRQRSNTLGVVTAGLGYFGPSRTLNGVTNAAEKAGYYLTVFYQGQEKTVRGVDGGTDAPADYWQAISIVKGIVPQFTSTP
jgi:DNA-binding LacI/PurR family transcriptional regulator